MIEKNIKGRIIKEIKKLAKTHKDLSYTTIRQINPKLINRALQRFRSWRKAVEAAGIDYDEVRRGWSKRKILSTIKETYAKGGYLHAGYVSRHQPSLYYAGRRLFGSWGNTVTKAGLNYRKIRRKERWTKREVIEQIRTIYKRDREISADYVRSIERGLVSAGCKYFGTWPKAIEAAGIDYSETLKFTRWTKEKVLKRIKRYLKEGKPINTAGVKSYDRIVYAAAERLFGSWEMALTKAGLDYDKIRKLRYWSKPLVIEEIKKLIAQGKSLKAKDVDSRLTSAARRYFGGKWANALKATGYKEE